MPRQPDHARFQAEPLAAELGPQPDAARGLHQRGLELEVPEGMPGGRAAGGQAVQVAGRGELDGLQGQLGRGPADDHRQVIRRAGGGAQRLHLARQVVDQALGVEDGLGFLEQEGLVGRPAALGDEEEAVLVAGDRVELHLGGQVAAGVDLLVHGEGCVLRVAQVAAGVGVEDPAGESLLVAVAAEDPLALFADHDGRAGVLAHREDHLGRDHRVLHELERDVAVVGGALRVLEDLRQQLQVRGTVEVRHVGERLPRQQRQRLGRHLQDFGPLEPDRGHVAFGQPTVLGPVPRKREHLLEFELVHAHTSRQHRHLSKRFYCYQCGPRLSRQFSNKEEDLHFSRCRGMRGGHCDRFLHFSTDRMHPNT